MASDDSWTVTPPEGLTTAEFVLRPLTETDAAADFEAVVESRADLVGWEQSGWPSDDFTVEENRDDLRGLEADHRSGRRFTYTVVEPSGAPALGCVYVVPPTARFLAAADVTSTGGRSWSDVDAAVYFWVRSGRVASGVEGRLLDALRAWFDEAWELTAVVYVTTADFGRQVALLDAAGLIPAFEIHEPGKPTPYVAFAEPWAGVAGPTS